MLLEIVIFVSIAVSTVFFKRWRNYISIINKVPGPKPTILGNIADIGTFKKDTPKVPRLAIFFERIKAFSELHGKDGLVKMWLGNTVPNYLITNPKYAETIFNSSTLITKSREYGFLYDWLGEGLLTSAGNKWKTRRRLLNPAFHVRILEDFIDIINDQSKISVNILERKETLSWFDVVPLITRLTLDIICETSMGLKMNIQSDDDSEYLKNLHCVSKIVIERGPRPWLHPNLIFNQTKWGKEYHESLKYLHDFTLKVIRERKSSFKVLDDVENLDTENFSFNNKKKRFAFLDLLLNEHFKNPEFGENDIREEVDTFMFAGHDTTAMGLSWTLYLIGLYPEVQNKIYEELQSIFCDDFSRNVTYDDLKDLKYLDSVIKESHRLYPPVPYVGRKLTEETVIGGHALPKGSEIWPLIFVMQRDPKVFPDPEVFNPENFNPENPVSRHPFSYIPFSAGPRNCIGQRFAQMEEKTVLAHVLRNFRIESLDHRDKVVTTAEMVLRPVRGIRMRIRKRKIQ